MESIILCTGGYDHTIRLWNVLQSNCVAVYQHNESHINALAIAPDRSSLAAAGNPSIRLYDQTASQGAVGAGLPFIVLQMSDDEGYRTNVIAIEYYDKNVVFAAGEDGSLRLFDLRSSKKCITKSQLLTAPSTICFSSSFQVVYGTGNGRLGCFDISSGKILWERKVGEGCNEISAISLNTQGLCIFGDYSGKFYQLKEEQFAKLEMTHARYITSLSFSPDDKYLVSTSADKTAKLCHLENGSYQQKWELKGHEKWVWDATFSADSAYVLTASSDSTARLWENDKGECVSIYSGQHTKGITAIALNDYP